MEIVEVAEEPEEEEHEQLGMEQIPDEGQLPVEDEMQSRRSPLIHSPPNVRENFSEPVECSKSNQGNTKIVEMLVSMKKEMEERERDGNNNKRSERSFWRLTSEEGSNDGNKYSNIGTRNGNKK